MQGSAHLRWNRPAARGLFARAHLPLVYPNDYECCVPALCHVASDKRSSALTCRNSQYAFSPEWKSLALLDARSASVIPGVYWYWFRNLCNVQLYLHFLAGFVVCPCSVLPDLPLLLLETLPQEKTQLHTLEEATAHPKGCKCRRSKCRKKCDYFYSLTSPMFAFSPAVICCEDALCWNTGVT